jgi:hypothetical protein
VSRGDVTDGEWSFSTLDSPTGNAKGVHRPLCAGGEAHEVKGYEAAKALCVLARKAGSLALTAPVFLILRDFGVCGDWRPSRQARLSIRRPRRGIREEWDRRKFVALALDRLWPKTRRVVDGEARYKMQRPGCAIVATREVLPSTPRDWGSAARSRERMPPPKTALG